MIAIVLQSALLAWASFLAGTGVFAVGRARRRRAADPISETDHHAGDAIVIRPCFGVEATLERALFSTAGARDIANAKIVFAVPNVDDGAFPVARSVARELALRGLDVELRISTVDGPNNKAMQLDAVLAKNESRSIVVVADSDVDLTDYPLAALLAPIRNAHDVAAAWAPPFEDPSDPTWGDSISRALLSGSLHAFPLLASLDGQGFTGKVFSARVSSVARIGGFRALRHVLGEDWELARRVRSLGERTVVASSAVRAISRGRSIHAVLERMTRWLMVARGQRPSVLLGYPLLFSATWIIVIAASVSGLGYVSACAIIVALGARLHVGRASASLVGLAPPSMLFMLQADVALLVALGRTLVSRRVKWRARELVLGRRGTLTET